MPEQAQILSHVLNSGIVQLPGRRFPGIVMQGDTVFNLFQDARDLLTQARQRRDEDGFYAALSIAEQLQAQLRHYEETLAAQGSELPYIISIARYPVTDDFDAPPTN